MACTLQGTTKRMLQDIQLLLTCKCCTTQRSCKHRSLAIKSTPSSQLSISQSDSILICPLPVTVFSQGDKYVDKQRYKELQPDKKKGFLTSDFSKRDEFSNTIRTNQWREQLTVSALQL